MAITPLILRNAPTDAQARANADNSAVLRNPSYNENYPGAIPVPIVTSSLAVAVSTSITGTGVPGATIKPYFDNVLGTSFVVPVNGIWTFAASATAGSYKFTQTIAGQDPSGFSATVVTT